MWEKTGYISISINIKIQPLRISHVDLIAFHRDQVKPLMKQDYYKHLPFGLSPQAIVTLTVVISFTEYQFVSHGSSQQSGYFHNRAVLPTAKNSPSLLMVVHSSDLMVHGLQ